MRSSFLAVCMVFATSTVFVAGSLPVLADTLDSIPPTIGMVSPETFRVNDLVTVTASIADNGTVGFCHLFVDQVDMGAMRVSGGVATIAQIFATPATRRLQVRCDDAVGNVGLSSVTAIRADVPTVSKAGVLPVGFSSGMLVRLSCLPGETIDEHCQSIYEVGQDAKRHAFQNTSAYQSWHPDGGNVMDISLSVIANLPLGSPILIKPGSSAIRFLSQPAVYDLTPPNLLKKFSSDVAAATAFGATWKSHVVVLTDAFYQNFTFGSPIADPHTLSALMK